ncbi:3-deoxy-7-phosphoheptulonate synthase [Desulfofalx alkaliphila]|uniref:3-deoxy-7-phosphoheptulonate synthase n=1 Tax=Desulfofalx alkaliphila TaxID=105483 RepID=UPI0004E272DE|nr:3-deoxy-7-phosphoheptulonate synthase [Desulfofalx alkaliphila]
MIVVMSHLADQRDIDSVINKLKNFGFQVHLSQGVERTIIGAVGDRTQLLDVGIEAMPGVEKLVPIMRPYKLASRVFKEEDTVVQLGNGVAVGGGNLTVMAGPCAVESKEQLFQVAKEAKEAGAAVLRGGAYKPRTSPYSFQGLEEEGLKLLAEARELTGMPVVTEVMDVNTLPLVCEYADVLQIGARNMQNFFLLREVAKTDKPVLLKRSPAGTIEEWLMAAEYILAGGNPKVILCERGIKTFETFTRNTLDLTAVPVVKYLSHLPVVVDPSHAIGNWRFVQDMSRAAVAAGADGLLIEVHPNPAEALCDGPQSLTPDNFTALMQELKRIAPAMGKSIN